MIRKSGRELAVGDLIVGYIIKYGHESVDVHYSELGLLVQLFPPTKNNNVRSFCLGVFSGRKLHERWLWNDTTYLVIE